MRSRPEAHAISTAARAVVRHYVDAIDAIATRSSRDLDGRSSCGQTLRRARSMRSLPEVRAISTTARAVVRHYGGAIDAVATRSSHDLDGRSSCGQTLRRRDRCDRDPKLARSRRPLELWSDITSARSMRSRTEAGAISTAARAVVRHYVAAIDAIATQHSRDLDDRSTWARHLCIASEVGTGTGNATIREERVENRRSQQRVNGYQIGAMSAAYGTSGRMIHNVEPCAARSHLLCKGRPNRSWLAQCYR